MSPIVKKLVPKGIYEKIYNLLNKVPSFHWLFPHRLNPISRLFGLDRGLPIDRYYIESFLEQYRADIHGQVLEIGDPTYTLRFGGKQVSHSDVLHVRPGNPRATIIGDLVTGQNIPFGFYDCIILTQTLLCIYDLGAATKTVYAALKPGGVVLGTVPGISQISRYDMNCWGDYWRFTDASARELFVPVFGAVNTMVETYGNLAAACAYLQGYAAKDLRRHQLDYHDSDYQVIITFRAQKNGKQ